MKKTFATVMAALVNAWLFAQDGGGGTKKVDVDINAGGGGGGMWGAPWLWVVGAAVFILLLVALTRGSRRAD